MGGLCKIHHEPGINATPSSLGNVRFTPSPVKKKKIIYHIKYKLKYIVIVLSAFAGYTKISLDINSWCNTMEQKEENQGNA